MGCWHVPCPPVLCPWTPSLACCSLCPRPDALETPHPLLQPQRAPSTSHGTPSPPIMALPLHHRLGHMLEEAHCFLLLELGQGHPGVDGRTGSAGLGQQGVPWPRMCPDVSWGRGRRRAGPQLLRLLPLWHRSSVSCSVWNCPYACCQSWEATIAFFGHFAFFSHLAGLGHCSQRLAHLWGSLHSVQSHMIQDTIYRVYFFKESLTSRFLLTLVYSLNHLHRKSSSFPLRPY